MPSLYMETAAAGETYWPPGLKRSETFPAAAVGQELAACSGEVQTQLGRQRLTAASPLTQRESLGPCFLPSAGCRRVLVPTAVLCEARGAMPVAPLPPAVSNGGEEGWAVSAGGARVATRAP